MNLPTYDELLDFYYNFLEAEQDREIEENEIIELLQVLLNGYLIWLTILSSFGKPLTIKVLSGVTGDDENLPFIDLYSDFQLDFSDFKAYQKYEKFLDCQ